MACWTVVIFSASSSGISISNSSSRAITSSTVSSESAPRSSTNEASFVTCSCLTPSCSATMALTCCSTVLISGCSLCGLGGLALPAASLRLVARQRARYCRGTPPRLPLGISARECLFLLAKLPGCGAQPARPRSPPPVGPSRHVHAAVDVQRLARDVAGRRRDQKKHGGRDVLRGSETGERNALEERRALRLVQHTRHVGVDEARGHGVHRDAAGGELLRE